MIDKRPSSAKTRRTCFEANKKADETGRIYMVCHICNGVIWPGREAWEADHVTRRVLSGDDSASNLRPAHVKCHREKTKSDISENAKGKRVSEKHFGVKTRNPQTGWKRRLDGTVIRRER